MPASVTVAAPSLNRRVAGQGALLLGGVVAGQLFAFARHAVLAYGLARGAFGTAMAILLTLQLIEALTDLAPERLILQADDGPTAKLISVGHTVAILRGIAGAALLYCATDWIAAFFSIPDAAPAFAMMALVPLIKGLQHLDQRRAQRRLDNGPAMLVELVPAVLGLALAWPLVRLLGSYDVIVWLFIGQALAQVAVSHAIAREPYRVARDPETLRRSLAFGWPMIAAALPQAAESLP